MRPRFFYLVPDDPWRRAGESWFAHVVRRNILRRQLPNGGVKIIYQHCALLRELGYEAWPVHLARFSVRWFSHALAPLSVAEASRLARATDVVLVPEVLPDAAGVLPLGRKVVLIQGWSTLERVLGTDGRYLPLGFERALCCSPFLDRYMAQREPALPRDVVVNGIDLARFVPAPERRVSGRVLVMMRKHADEARAAIAQLPPAVRDAADWLLIEQACGQEEMVRHYQSSDHFVATGYPEGFALPPLEAMACGCAVAGYTGGGGDAFMADGETALVAPDGDVAALSACLGRLLTDAALRERVRAGGQRVASRFSIEKMRQGLGAFAQQMTVGGDA